MESSDRNNVLRSTHPGEKQDFSLKNSSMLDKGDIKVLQGMFEEHGKMLQREIRDEVHSLLRASEHRIIGEITEFIADAIISQIDDHKTRMTRLEEKIA